MNKVLVITDSNSGVTQDEGKSIGVKVVSMPFIVDGEEFYEEITLSQEKFYELLKNPNVDVKTSQPSSYFISDLWRESLKEYDEIIYIPMSSGLSSSCQSATNLSHTDEFEGKVFVVDNQRISVTQKESVYEAVEMIKLGKTGKEIYDYLMDTKMLSSIYILVDTLKYLKKGGRVTPAAALLGSMLRIKPVLQIKGFKLDAFFKALNVKQAKLKMIAQLKADLEGEFKEYYEQGKMTISLAHTQNFEEVEKFKNEIAEAIPNVPIRFVDPLSLSVSCHIGPGALACTLCIKNY